LETGQTPGEEGTIMRENSLEVRLEAEKRRVGQFMLTAEATSAHYAVNLDPEASFALH
jgi:hypothetical protein